MHQKNPFTESFFFSVRLGPKVENKMWYKSQIKFCRRNSSNLHIRTLGLSRAKKIAGPKCSRLFLEEFKIVINCSRLFHNVKLTHLFTFCSLPTDILLSLFNLNYNSQLWKKKIKQLSIKKILKIINEIIWVEKSRTTWIESLSHDNKFIPWLCSTSNWKTNFNWGIASKLQESFQFSLFSIWIYRCKLLKYSRKRYNYS